MLSQREIHVSVSYVNKCFTYKLEQIDITVILFSLKLIRRIISSLSLWSPGIWQCNLLDRQQHFRRACWLSLQGKHSYLLLPALCWFVCLTYTSALKMMVLYSLWSQPKQTCITWHCISEELLVTLLHSLILCELKFILKCLLKETEIFVINPVCVDHNGCAV